MIKMVSFQDIKMTQHMVQISRKCQHTNRNPWDYLKIQRLSPHEKHWVNYVWRDLSITNDMLSTDKIIRRSEESISSKISNTTKVPTQPEAFLFMAVLEIFARKTQSRNRNKKH